MTVTVGQFVRFSRTALYLPPFFAMVRVYVCALLIMSVLAFRVRYVFIMDAITSPQTQLTRPHSHQVC